MYCFCEIIKPFPEFLARNTKEKDDIIVNVFLRGHYKIFAKHLRNVKIN